MRRSLLVLVLLLAQAAWAQAPQPAPPSLEATRQAMAIPSSATVRGQQDGVGFARSAEQMARVWELAAAPPAPERLGPKPAPGVAGVICPHDDYLYAGRVYRDLLPLVTARTVVLVGVFHKYRRFGAKDALVFDPYASWRAPDGAIPVSPLREELLVQLAPAYRIQDAAMHDSEHSLEAIAFWLKHQRPDLEILPILVPAAHFPRFQELAGHLGRALAAAMARRHWALGRDLAIVISSDGVHYGADFHHTPFGDGGVEALVQASKRDRELLSGPLAGPVSAAKAEAFFSTCVDPAHPDDYRLPWCGRFSIPFGLLLLAETAEALGVARPVGMPVAFGCSVNTPELPVRALGMAATAPANLFHFVTFPAVAYVLPG